MTVLGIDPGRGKCGVAVCATGRVLAKAIVRPAELPNVVVGWATEHKVDVVVVGGGTGSREVMAALAGLQASRRLPPVTVEGERDTTLAARRRYFQEHPARGWRRLIPRSFQAPPEAYDDYAAVIIAERHLAHVEYDATGK